MDYGDWHEATVGGSAPVGGDGGDGNYDADVYLQQAIQQQERDAVLCLVDCQSSMFNQILSSSMGNASSREGSATRGPEVKRESLSASLASRNEEPATGETSFMRAMKCVLRFYQDKVVTSDKDVVALVLYNTREKKNVFDYNGVYVLHPFGLLGASSVQEVELLQFAGNVLSSYYAEFSKSVGYGIPLSASAQAPQGSVVCRLSDVLWTAQQMFLSLKSTAVKYRRVFVFTDDDDPCRDDQNERDRCATRVKDLREVGVEFEVFAFGSSSRCEAVYAPSSTSHSSSRPTLMSFTPSIPSPDTLASAAARGGGGGIASAKRTFNKERFWQWIVNLSVAKKEGALSVDYLTERSSEADAADQHLYHGGGVYVDSDGGMFSDLLDTVRRKTHPQRPTQSLRLFIGFRADKSVTEQEVPTMLVSVFNPLMPASALKSEWVDGASNVLAKREVRYVTRPQEARDLYNKDEATDNNADEADSSGAAGKPKKKARDVHGAVSLQEQSRKMQAVNDPNSAEGVTGIPVQSKSSEDSCYPVQASELRLSTAVGGTRVYFTPAERAAVTAAAAAGAPQGINIVCFKRQEDILKYKHNLKRSSFLHPNLRYGGAASLKLFVQLHRVLTKQRKVAVAQAVLRKTSAPSIVALVPAPCGSSGGADINAWLGGGAAGTAHDPLQGSLPTEGMGFYVVPLPYAEDIRSVPFRTNDTLAHLSGEFEGEAASSAVKSEYVEKAKRIIDALTVEYDIIAVPNPSLQKQYTMIQHLALRYDHATDTTPASNANNSGTEATVFSTRLSKVENSEAEGQFEDLTLPDYAGMARYSEHFKDFASAVLTPDYDAEKQCTARAPAPSRARKVETAASRASPPAKKKPTQQQQQKRETVKKEKEEGSQNGSGSTQSAVDETLIALVAEHHATGKLSRLTVSQLKTYLDMVNVSTRGLKLKDDYVSAVKNHITQ